MKILFLGHNLRYIGTYWRMWFLARGLVKIGHEVTLVTVSPKRKWNWQRTVEDGVEVLEGPNWLEHLPGGGTGPLDILGRIALVAHRRFDVVHGFEYHPNVRIPMSLARLQGRALIVSDWCDWFSHGGLGPRWGRYPLIQKFIEKLENQIRQKADCVTVISKCLEDQSLSLGILAERILYVPGGAPVDLIMPMEKQVARKKWAFSAETKIVGFLGNYQADMELVLESFATVARKYPESLLMIVGNKWKKEGGDLRRKAQKLGIEKNLKETGFVPYQDIPSLLACADVFALPLRDTENNRARWPNKIGEYLSAGRPVITQQTGEMKRFFERYAVGIAVTGGSLEFGEALLAILEDDRKSESIGITARNTAEKILAWDKLSQDLAEFYMKQITKSNALGRGILANQEKKTNNAS